MSAPRTYRRNGNVLWTSRCKTRLRFQRTLHGVRSIHFWSLVFTSKERTEVVHIRTPEVRLPQDFERHGVMAVDSTLSRRTSAANRVVESSGVNIEPGNLRHTRHPQQGVVSKDGAAPGAQMASNRSRRNPTSSLHSRHVAGGRTSKGVVWALHLPEVDGFPSTGRSNSTSNSTRLTSMVSLHTHAHGGELNLRYGLKDGVLSQHFRRHQSLQMCRHPRHRLRLLVHTFPEER